MPGRKGVATTIAAAAIAGAIGFSASPGGAAQETALDTSQGAFTAGALNHGWWSDARPNTDTNANYMTGTLGGVRRRNFFVFDLSAVDGEIVGARLDVTRGREVNTEATETVELFDVSTTAATLAARGNPSASVYADLGSGTSYGIFDIATGGSPTEILRFDLNAAAVADLNAAVGGYWAVGGSLITNDGADSVFGMTQSAGPQRLVLDVLREIPATVDIKPDSADNPINPRSHGVVPVAVLTDDLLDATTILPDTARFGPGGAAPAHAVSIEDVDGDGDDDVLLHFATDEAGLAAADGEACVTGETVSGRPFRGCDTVRMVGGGPTH